MGNLTEKRLKEIREGRGYGPSATEAREMARMLLDAAENRNVPADGTVANYLVKTRGNQTQAALQLNVNRATLHKYIDDKNGQLHRIINGTLMVATQQKGKNRWQTPT